MSSKVQLYDSPHQFEPLLPAVKLEPLIARTRGVFERSMALKGVVSAPAHGALRELVREMNSYYSNRIEGQATHPANIAGALRQHFSDKPDTARRQRLALAHIEAERELEGTVESEAQALSSAFLIRAHAALYERLQPAERQTDEGQVVEPGQLRNKEVRVGRHIPPSHGSLPRFLTRMDQVYGRLQGMDEVLINIACAHHRAAWTHPFLDGNGRAVRLQTHCALSFISGGLWSVNRGLARRQNDYYAHLDSADEPRRGDLDGRGNLSQAALLEWCDYFIGVCEDQVDFMSRMLDINGLKERIAHYVLFENARHGSASGYRQEAVLPLQMTAIAGPIERGDFIRMMGLEDRTARKAISRLISDGVLISESHKAPLAIAFPLNSLSILFPNLYPEAASTLVD